MQEFRFNFLNPVVWHKYWPPMVEAFWLTVVLAAAIVVTGFVLGAVLANLRCLAPRWVRYVIIIFADVSRAVPPLAILVVLYFALPFVDITIPPFTTAWLGLSLVLAAFVEEILYGGLRTIPRGQWEAARSTGLGVVTTLLVIVFPQALRMTIGPLVNRAVAISKNTALGSVISVPEILNQASSAQSDSANTTPLTMAALLYLGLFLPFVVLCRWVERRFPQRRL